MVNEMITHILVSNIPNIPNYSIRIFITVLLLLIRVYNSRHIHVFKTAFSGCISPMNRQIIPSSSISLKWVMASLIMIFMLNLKQDPITLSCSYIRLINIRNISLKTKDKG